MDAKDWTILTEKLVDHALMQNEAITHYDHFIEYLKKRTDTGVIKQFLSDTKRSMDRKYRQRLKRIGTQIGESYFSDGCIYCKQYDNICIICKLWRANKCCGGLWIKMCSAHNFEDMLYYAIKIRQYIIEHG